MPETRAQKRSQVDKLATGHKRARRRSSDSTIDGHVIRSAGPDESTAKISAQAKGKQPERIVDDVRKDQCHVYLAGPEDFRSGLDEEGNERLETVAETLLHRGRGWGKAEMLDARTFVRAHEHARDKNIEPTNLWAGKRWRTMRMQALKMYDLQEDAIRTWRYSAPPLPTGLDLGIIGTSHEETKMTSNIRDIPEWRRTSAAESFQLFRPQKPAFKPFHMANDVDPETPPQGASAVNFVTGARGQTILLSPFSISNNSSEPLEIPRRPPDPEWLDPELDHLPDFVWGWDQGLEKAAQTESQRESLTMWRQSLSGSQNLRRAPNQSLSIAPAGIPLEEAGMVSCLTDPSVIEETVSAQLHEDAPSGGPGKTSHYQPLPLRLAPFELPKEGSPLAPLREGAGGPINKPAKRRKGPAKAVATKQHPSEALKEVKPMKQELSPFILRPRQSGRNNTITDIPGPISSSVPPSVQNKTSTTNVAFSHTETDGLQHDDAEPDVSADIALRHLGDQAAQDDVQIDLPFKHTPESAQRQEMRDLMLRDKRFGQMFDAITESTSLPVPEDGPAYTQIPNQAFGAPVKMPSLPHPFHPSIAELIQTRPKLRVRWLIPVHGPAGLLTHQEINPKFWPSPALVVFGMKSRTIHNATNDKIMTYITNRRRRDHLVWTKETLSKFWNETSKLRIKGTCGPISISLSGPYPDPFRPAIAPLSISSHRYVEHGDMLDPSHPPVRAHIGDHIRIGCDLEHALIFRMWLGTRTFGLKPPTDYRSDTGLPQEKRKYDNNPFLRVKLCLIGPLGELLAVI